MMINSLNVNLHTNNAKMDYTEVNTSEQLMLNPSENVLTNETKTNSMFETQDESSKLTQADAQAIAKLVYKGLSSMKDLRDDTLIGAARGQNFTQNLSQNVDINDEALFLINEARANHENLLQTPPTQSVHTLTTQGILKNETDELSVQLSFNLSKSFTDAAGIGRDAQLPKSIEVRLNGEIPAISKDKFNFFVDADGESDQVSRLDKGEEILRVSKEKIAKKNEIKDELKKEALKELAAEKKAQQLDENDEIFNRLRVWEGDVNERRLIGLGEVGEGAVFLADPNGNFDGLNSYQGGANFGFNTPTHSTSAAILNDTRGTFDRLKQNLDRLNTQLQTASEREAKEIYVQISNIEAKIYQ
ncbi:hypothetical protein [Campylobacter suis]|nr:hypothetical protein [Campylobacter suis]